MPLTEKRNTGGGGEEEGKRQLGVRSIFSVSGLQNKGVGQSVEYESNHYPRQEVHAQTQFSDGLWSIQTFLNQHLITERFQIGLHNFGFSGKLKNLATLVLNSYASTIGWSPGAAVPFPL